LPTYKDEKRGTWFCKIRYTDWQGNRKETTKRGFSTKREAKEFEEEYRRKMSGTSDMTLESLYQLYIADKRQNVKESSVDTVMSALRTHVLPTLGKMNLTDITPAVIRKWQNDLAHKDAYRRKKPLSPTTLKNINRKLCTMLNFAVRYYGLKQNPLQVTGQTGKYERRVDFWSKEEFEQFLSAVTEPIYKYLFSLLYYTGMRIGEALALTKDDFDIENNVLRVNKNYTQKKRTTTPKTDYSERYITIPKKVSAMLQDILARLAYNTDRLFPLYYGKVNYHYNKAIKLSGVRDLALHCLRHAHASELLDGKMPITAVSHRLGHSSPQITMAIYAHPTQDSDKEIADFLDKN
jgi:integrase